MSGKQPTDSGWKLVFDAPKPEQANLRETIYDVLERIFPLEHRGQIVGACKAFETALAPHLAANERIYGCYFCGKQAPKGERISYLFCAEHAKKGQQLLAGRFVADAAAIQAATLEATIKLVEAVPWKHVPVGLIERIRALGSSDVRQLNLDLDTERRIVQAATLKAAAKHLDNEAEGAELLMLDPKATKLGKSFARTIMNTDRDNAKAILALGSTDLLAVHDAMVRVEEARFWEPMVAHGHNTMEFNANMDCAICQHIGNLERRAGGK